jgi:hypothetical protein
VKFFALIVSRAIPLCIACFVENGCVVEMSMIQQLLCTTVRLVTLRNINRPSLLWSKLFSLLICFLNLCLVLVIFFKFNKRCLYCNLKCFRIVTDSQYSYFFPLFNLIKTECFAIFESTISAEDLILGRCKAWCSIGEMLILTHFLFIFNRVEL